MWWDKLNKEILHMLKEQERISPSIKIRLEELKTMQKSYMAFLTWDVHCNTICEVQVTPLPGQEAAA